jgi:hypothetical protein
LNLTQRDDKRTKRVELSINYSENIFIRGLKEDIIMLNWKLSLVLQTLLFSLQNSLKLLFTNLARNLLHFSLLFQNAYLRFVFPVIKLEGL